jgi:hypothetical protein
LSSLNSVTSTNSASSYNESASEDDEDRNELLLRRTPTTDQPPARRKQGRFSICVPEGTPLTKRTSPETETESDSGRGSRTPPFDSGDDRSGTGDSGGSGRGGASEPRSKTRSPLSNLMTDQKESANPKEGGRGINATGLVHSPSNSMAHSNESSGDVVSTKTEGTDDPFDDGEEDEDEDDEDDTDRPLSPMPSPGATNKPSRFVLPTPGGPVCAATEGNNGAAARSSPSTDVPTNINILAMQHNNTSGNNNSHTTAVTTATTATTAATTTGTTTTTTTTTATTATTTTTTTNNIGNSSSDNNNSSTYNTTRMDTHDKSTEDQGSNSSTMNTNSTLLTGSGLGSNLTESSYDGNSSSSSSSSSSNCSSRNGSTMASQNSTVDLETSNTARVGRFKRTTNSDLMSDAVDKTQRATDTSSNASTTTTSTQANQETNNDMRRSNEEAHSGEDEDEEEDDDDDSGYSDDSGSDGESDLDEMADFNGGIRQRENSAFSTVSSNSDDERRMSLSSQVSNSGAGIGGENEDGRRRNVTMGNNDGFLENNDHGDGHNSGDDNREERRDGQNDRLERGSESDLSVGGGSRSQSTTMLRSDDDDDFGLNRSASSTPGHGSDEEEEEEEDDEEDDEEEDEEEDDEDEDEDHNPRPLTPSSPSSDNHGGNDSNNNSGGGRKPSRFAVVREPSYHEIDPTEYDGDGLDLDDHRHGEYEDIRNGTSPTGTPTMHGSPSPRHRETREQLNARRDLQESEAFELGGRNSLRSSPETVMIQRMPMRDLRVMHRSYHDGISQLIEDHEDLQDRYRRAREELSQARNRIQELEKQVEERR